MRRARRSARVGAVLLEVLVALTILSTAGAALIAMTVDAMRAVERARAADAELQRANAFFNAVALWPREDLDRHLGDRHQGKWIMRVDRPGSDLYVVELRDSTRRRVLLRTSLYRPEAAHVAP
jgi:type II secretory pathway pseudopilin PulG